MTEREAQVANGDKALAGPFPPRQLARLEATIARASELSGLRFSLYVGDLAEPARQAAQLLHAGLADPGLAVLIAVSPNQRVLEIVTGAQARQALPDRSCRLAALAMASAFSGGDLAGGIVAGVTQLADHAERSPRSLKRSR